MKALLGVVIAAQIAVDVWLLLPQPRYQLAVQGDVVARINTSTGKTEVFNPVKREWTALGN